MIFLGRPKQTWAVERGGIPPAISGGRLPSVICDCWTGDISCRSRMPFAFLHCSGQCAVRFRPGSFHLWSERCAKTLLERPEQGSTHCPIVIRRDTVTPVPL